jgi:hypothetical protein
MDDWQLNDSKLAGILLCAGVHRGGFDSRAIWRIHDMTNVRTIKAEAKAAAIRHALALMLGRYSFAVHDSVARGELRPLRSPTENP